MKTVIVPGISNAAVIDNYAVVKQTFPGELIHYIFLDIWAVPDNYNDLITKLDRRGRAVVSKECCEAVARFSEAGQQCTAAIDHIYGDSVPVFRNYCEHHSADLVIFDEAAWMDNVHFAERDIFRMVMRSGFEVLYLPKTNGAKREQVVRMSNVTTKGNRQPASVGVTSATAVSGRFPITHTADHSVGISTRFTSVDQMLNDIQNHGMSEDILIRQVSRLNRYFMKQSTVQRMLTESNRDLLWLRK
jgi:hypothetical protein